MDMILSDVRAVAETMFLGGDWIYLGMIIAAVLIGLFAMRSFGQILCVSLLAMVALGLIWIVYGGATSETPTDPAVWMSQLDAGWASISAVNGATLVAYLIVFAIAIGVLFLARSLLFRG